MENAIHCLQMHYDDEMEEFLENKPSGFVPDDVDMAICVDNALERWSLELNIWRSAGDEPAARDGEISQTIVCDLIEGQDYSRLEDHGFKF